MDRVWKVHGIVWHTSEWQGNWDIKWVVVVPLELQCHILCPLFVPSTVIHHLKTCKCQLMMGGAGLVNWIREVWVLLTQRPSNLKHLKLRRASWRKWVLKQHQAFWLEVNCSNALPTFGLLPSCHHHNVTLLHPHDTLWQTSDLQIRGWPRVHGLWFPETWKAKTWNVIKLH